MGKYISCEICEGKKQPLFAIKDKTGKHYICKRCIETYNAKISTPIVKRK